MMVDEHICQFKMNPVVCFVPIFESVQAKEFVIGEFIKYIRISGEDKDKDGGTPTLNQVYIHNSKLSRESSKKGLSNVNQWLTTVCRSVNLLPNDRTIILPICNQQQVIQISMAKITRKNVGEFSAAASNVLDIWKLLHSSSQNSHSKEEIEHSLCVDPEARDTQRIINDYNEFLQQSGTIDHFTLLGIIMKNLEKEDSEVAKKLKNTIIIIEGVESQSSIEIELIKCILNNGTIYKANVPFSFYSNSSDSLNISGIGEDALQSNIGFEECGSDSSHAVFGKTSVTFEKASETSVILEKTSEISVTFERYSFNDVPNQDDHLQSKSPSNKKSTELYIEHLIMAHLRLLLNTRDEIALATALNMPGREIEEVDFNAIKAVAQGKNMPIYQSIMSTVIQLDLGGKGYRPESTCPIVKHYKPLKEFVNFIMKLQNIIEEENDHEKAFSKILSTIKNSLCRIPGQLLSRRSIENVVNRFSNHLCSIQYADAMYEEIERPVEKSGPAEQTIAVCKKLKMSLKYLRGLCDIVSGFDMNFLIENVLDNSYLLTQRTPGSSGKKHTPFKVPSLMSLFRSPSSPLSPKTTPLAIRMVRKQGRSSEKDKKKKRFQSCCDWAPGDLSPIISDSPLQDSTVSPLQGPTLVETKPRTCDWRKIIEELPNDDESASSKNSEISSPKVVKKKIKRSLLTDISNLSGVPAAKKSKDKNSSLDFVNDEISKKAKPKCDAKSNASNKTKCKAKKNKPLLSGQKSIISFFKK